MGEIEDPLGEEFCRLRSADERRRQGQTFTPPSLIAAMIRQAQDDGDAPFTQIIDPGAGSGRFTLAAGLAFPQAALVAIESDPACAEVLRENLASAGLIERTTVIVGDYREAALPSSPGRRLFIGNPPYVRHQQIDKPWKDWYADTMWDLGARQASQRAGLHLHFFARTGQLAAPGDLAIFVTAAEWLHTQYGRALRTALHGALGGVSVHVIADPFPGVMSTAAVTMFRPHAAVAEIRFPEIDIPASGTRVGDFFRVSRGQATGANRVWIAGERARELPDRFLVPCVTGATELFDAGGRLERLDHLRRVVDFPRDLNIAGEPAVEAFLTWARGEGADQGYIATHRKPWWSVHLHDPAPIVCTYMARRPPVFVRNIAGARLLNIAHGLYPRSPLSEEELDAACLALNKAATLGDGRLYAGGLIKFEPSAVEEMRIDWITPPRTDALPSIARRRKR